MQCSKTVEIRECFLLVGNSWLAVTAYCACSTGQVYRETSAAC